MPIQKSSENPPAEGRIRDCSEPGTRTTLFRGDSDSKSVAMWRWRKGEKAGEISVPFLPRMERKVPPAKGLERRDGESTRHLPRYSRDHAYFHECSVSFVVMLSRCSTSPPDVLQANSSSIHVALLSAAWFPADR